MRTLVYAMQSSGASWFTYLLGQQPDSICVIDLHHGYLAPAIEHSGDVIIKCVITTRFSLAEHKVAFNPDRTILFLRDESDNVRSLSTKPWADRSGTIAQKLSILNGLDRGQFDQVLHYEGIPRTRQTRSVEDVIKFNRQHSPWCDAHYKQCWGIGGIHVDKPDSPAEGLAVVGG